MQYIKGPDFPTGGFILGRSGIRNAFETGRGTVIMRAKTMVEEMPNGKSRIIVYEIPYMVNKASLVERIAALRLHDRELDVMLLRPRQCLFIALVARKMDKLDVRIILQCFRVCLGNARHFSTARRTPRRREQAEVVLGILLEVLVEQEIARLQFLHGYA